MTAPADALKNEVRELIKTQIEAFRRPASLSSSELNDHHSRARKIKQLGQELDRLTSIAILEERFKKAS